LVPYPFKPRVSHYRNEEPDIGFIQSVFCSYLIPEVNTMRLLDVCIITGIYCQAAGVHI
jgi:hypothetical protein